MYKYYSIIAISFIFLLCIINWNSLVHQKISSKVYIVGKYKVKEDIYKTTNFPDHQYKRVYWVKDGLFWHQIGAYENEDRTGITIAPELVEDWLVIYSSSHLFLWSPELGKQHFYPFIADGWYEYSKQNLINGHYDYKSFKFQIKNGYWFAIYKCVFCNGKKPKKLIFTLVPSNQRWSVGTRKLFF